MFKNPGKRIKTLARFNFWFLLIGSIVAGIILLGTDYVPIGLPLLLGGPCIAYVENLLLFGFGDLVENSVYAKSEEKLTESSAHCSIPVVQKPTTPQATPVPVPAKPTASTNTHEEKTQVTSAKPIISTKSPDFIICPTCKLEQRSCRKVCWECGTKFE